MSFQNGRTIIEEVKSRLDIVDLVGSQVELRRAGKDFKGRCPFHEEKTPSFVVSPERQSYHCYGCGKSGDVISYLMETERLPFVDALKQLAERAGVTYETPRAPDPEKANRENRLLELNRLAARYFNHLLLTSTEGAAARSYLEGRGIERSSWDSWTLGYAPDSWDAALKYLRTRNYTIEELAAVGLVIERTGGGGHYDRFRRRVMFPIRDKDGQVVAFGGRAIGDGAPKYMNSPESTVFVKGEHLYGMDVAQGAIRDAKQAVVVEGYVDAVVAHAADFTNVVATLGTALTPVHVRNIAKLTRNVCLALDADAAGDTAAMRGWEVLRDAMRGRTIPIRSGGRVISSDRRTDVNVTIARLPRGEDPDTFIRKSPDGWRELIATARPVVEHFFAAVSESADLTTPDGRTQAVTELAPVVADVGNPIERAHYEARLGEMVGLQEHEIHMQVVRSRRAGRSSQVAYTPLQSVSQEDLTLALILRYPRLIHETPPGYADELENVQNREVLEAMHRVGQESLTTEALLEAVEAPLGDHVRRLAALVSLQPELLSNEQPDELHRRIGLVRRRRLHDMIQHHSQLLKEAKEMGDEAGVQALLSATPDMALEVRTFDPPESPYFKDARRQ